jgi:hypothetical protein
MVIKPEQVAVLLKVGYHVVRDQGPKGTVRKIRARETKTVVVRQTLWR